MTAERKRYPVSAAVMRKVIGFAEILPNGRYSATYTGWDMREEVVLPGNFIGFAAAVAALRAHHEKDCAERMKQREVART